MILLGYLFLLLHTALGYSTVCERSECINLKDCPSAIIGLKKKITPVSCGFDGLSPMVCCVRMSGAIQNKRISEQKCEEYRQEKKQRIPSLGLVGGVDVQPFEMPHMAILGYGITGDIDWNCGGSLISDNFVLTAAHCAYTRYGDVSFVRLGDLDISSDMDIASPKNFQVTEIHIHPDYQLPSKYNDIALLKLNGTVEFSEFMRPACLHTSYTILMDTLLASGWGATEFGGEMHSALQKVNLKHLSKDTCVPFYKPAREMSKGILDERQLCASGDGKDTCQGDSGGPLQYKNLGKPITYTVVGVTSFGKNCGHVPGIYTRVSHYIPWIESIVWPN